MQEAEQSGGPAGADAGSANRALIDRLYDALDRHDGEAMAACYAPDAAFSDPVFRDLSGSEAGDMWRMLCSRADDLSVEAGEVEATEHEGSAHWVATYTFGPTGRKVVNDIRARFRFTDGLIVEHRDSFSLRHWIAMAMGPTGRLFGWTPPMQAAVRKRAAAQLRAFTDSR